MATKQNADFEYERSRLLQRIANEAATMLPELRDAVMAPGVLDAMAQVARENFVAPGDVGSAYRNAPLPIGFNQTISQPLVVALMTGLLAPRKSDRILEIGTGSGYQAAVLSRLVAEVFSVEIVPELAERARGVLAAAGVANVHIKVGDGHAGWPEEAPFDGIVVTAAADRVPQALLGQLARAGRMVLPLGRDRQMLAVVSRDTDGGHRVRELLSVRFVPFVEPGSGSQ